MMTKTNNPRLRRMIALLALAMAALLVVLSALAAPDAQAKKKHQKHHKRPPAINVVQCPTEANGIDCVGTAARDYLVGKEDNFDSIKGGEGNDIYDGKAGSDTWVDESATSNDYYRVPATEFSQLFNSAQLVVGDRGGSFDVLDLSPYRSSDFVLSKPGFGSLIMDGTGKRELVIENFFTNNTIDLFKFSDGTLTAEQIKSKV